MTRVTFSPGQNNFQVKFKSATENVTLKNQALAGNRIDSLSDVNTQSQPENSILVYDSASDTFVQQALSSIAAANTSVANVSLSGDVATFTRQDGSSFTLNLANISANNIAVEAVNTNSNFKVPFTNTVSDGSTDVRLQIESNSSQFVYNPNSGTLSAPALSTTSLTSSTFNTSSLVTSSIQMDNQVVSQFIRSVEPWSNPLDSQVGTALSIENQFTANSVFQSFVANTNPRIANFNSSGEVAAHLLPAANVTYDLGSADRAFRDLYISGNTIFIANNRISTDGNTISFVTDTGTNAKIEAGAVTIKDILGDITKDIILKASNGSFKTVSASDETQEIITKFEEIEVPGTATISTLVLSNVLGTQYGGTGLNSVTNNGVLVGKSSSALNYISGSSGEIFQVAANGTPTFSNVDGGTF